MNDCNHKILETELVEEIRSNICNGFSHFINKDIYYFGYREFYLNGETIGCCTYEKFQQIANADQALLNDMSVNYAQDFLFLKQEKCNFIVRSSNLANNTYLNKLLDIDMCNSLLFFTKNNNCISMYAFVTSISNNKSLNCFVNERELFEEFIFLHKNILHDIVSKEKYHVLYKQLFECNVMHHIFDNFNVPEIGLLTKNNECFTKKEEEYIKLILENITNKEMAYLLKVSQKTVDYHISKIKKKMNVRDRLHLTSALKESTKIKRYK